VLSRKILKTTCCIIAGGQNTFMHGPMHRKYATKSAHGLRN